MPGQTQQANEEMVELLKPYFRARTEPNKGFADACSMYLALPGLRGFWPMSSVDENGSAIDQSGQGRDMTIAGDPDFGLDILAPWCWYDGINDYHTRPDEPGLDIIGNENYITAGRVGLTIGTWFHKSTGPSIKGLIGKWNDNGVNQRSYLLYTDGTGLRFLVSNNGIVTAGTTVAIAFSSGAWYFAAGRYNPGTEVKAWLNEDTDISIAGIAPTLFNSNADFNIAAYNNGLATRRFDGYLAFSFLCALSLPDRHLFTLFEQTRPLFGV